jgi:hypothetical protein
MPWALTSPPPNTIADVGTEEFLIVLAIRVDTETGETEFLLSERQRHPEWVPLSNVKSAELSR